MQDSDEADNSSAPKARAKAAKGLRSGRSWMLRLPKRGSAEAEDVAGAETAVADPSSKSMTEGSTRFVLHPAACYIINSCFPMENVTDGLDTRTACPTGDTREQAW